MDDVQKDSDSLYLPETITWRMKFNTNKCHVSDIALHITQANLYKVNSTYSLREAPL